jgi:hypothetical protein
VLEYAIDVQVFEHHGVGTLGSWLGVLFASMPLVTFCWASLCGLFALKCERVSFLRVFFWF